MVESKKLVHFRKKRKIQCNVQLPGYGQAKALDPKRLSLPQNPSRQLKRREIILLKRN